jgi:histidine triad (HIT) family protein
VDVSVGSDATEDVGVSVGRDVSVGSGVGLLRGAGVSLGWAACVGAMDAWLVASVSDVAAAPQAVNIATDIIRRIESCFTLPHLLTIVDNYTFNCIIYRRVKRFRSSGRRRRDLAELYFLASEIVRKEEDMYSHAPDDYICPFCLLIRGIENEHVYTVNSDIVCHTEDVTAFIGSHQWLNNPGNVIVIPNQHFENVYELPVHFATSIHELIKDVALAMKAAYLCDGVSTRQHNEPAGNQDVWHYHVHVTPRYTGDEFYNHFTGGRTLMPAEKRAKLARKLRVHLTGQIGAIAARTCRF